MGIVLLVLFVMDMFLWMLSLLGAGIVAVASPWLAFFPCLFLGLAVFVFGSRPVNPS